MKTFLSLPAAVRAPFLVFGMLLLLPLLTFAGTIHSNLFIEPGKQFTLGGEQRGAFKVAVKNVGTVPVEIRERPLGGGTFGKATLAPGQSGVLKFAAGSTTVLLDPSSTKANLDLIITGDTKLGKTYEPVQEFGKPAPK